MTDIVSLSELRLLARQRADMENSQFISDDEWRRMINRSYAELYDLVVTSANSEDYFLKSDTISKLTNSDPFIFLENELQLRKKNNLPPFERFIALILTSKNEKKLEHESYKLKKYLEKNLNGKILGPINAPIYKIRKNFRNRLLIRSKKNYKIQESLAIILKKFEFSSGMKLTVDVDPISFN